MESVSPKIEFVLGRVTARTEEYIYDQIAAAAAADPLADILVVVPPQATFSTEAGLMKRLDVPGMMGVSVLSFTKLADRILREVRGLRRPSMDAAGKCMVMRLLLDEQSGALRSLRACAKEGMLAAELADLISEFKSYDISPGMLRGFSTGNGASDEKLADIAMLYEAFEARTEGVFDHEDKVNFVIGQLGGAGFIRKAHVYIHGYDMYDAQTTRFVRALMQTANRTTITFLHARANDNDAGVYRLCEFNHEKFVADAKALGLKTTWVDAPKEHAPDLLFLGDNLYAYPHPHKERARDISMTYAADAGQEVRAVAAQVACLTQKKGYEFRDIGIVCGSPDDYMDELARVFTKANIPLFTGKKRSLLSSAPALFVSTALELCAGRIKTDSVLAHAKTGLCNVDDKEISALQNYAYQNISNGFAFLKPFSKDAEAERARLALMGPLEELRARARGGAIAIIDALLWYMEALRVREKQQDMANALRDAGLVEEAEFAALAYERVEGALAQARTLFADGDLTARQLLRALRTALDAQQVGVIPPGADEITAGDISYIRLPGVRALFVLGVNEGKLPDYAPASDILTGEERELLLGQLAGLRFGGVAEKQQLAILRAFSGPSEKLFLSCVSDGASLPSPLLGRMKELFGEIRENDAADLELMLRENAYRPAVRMLRAAQDGMPDPLVSAVFADADGARQRLFVQAAESTNAPTRLSPSLTSALYGDIRGSASRVESYYNCPYQHFLSYGVRPKKLREHVADPLDVGLYAHDVLEGVSRALLDANKNWSQISEAELAALLEQSSEQARQRQSRFSLGRRNETVLAAVEREVRLAASAIHRQSAAGGMQAVQAERAFTQQCGGITISGVIDRVDTATVGSDEYFDVVDYKTGKAGFDLGAFFYGLQLQLLIYVMAAQEMLPHAQFAGAYYFNIQLPDLTKDADVTHAFRMAGILGADADVASLLYGREGSSLFSLGVKLNKDETYSQTFKNQIYGKEEISAMLAHTRRLLTRAVEGLQAGDDSITPAASTAEDTACRYCDYKSVCMFDPGYAGNRERPLGAVSRETAFARMREET